MQSIYYLLGYEREHICQEGSNKFFWKNAKKLINEEFLEKLVDYSPFGLKTHKVKAYQTINFLEKNIEGLGTQEEIEAQCGIYVGRLYKWLTLCLKVRKDEITYRKAQRQLALSMRDGLIQKEKERQIRLEQELAEAEQKFNEEHKDEIDAVQKWESD